VQDKGHSKSARSSTHLARRIASNLFIVQMRSRIHFGSKPTVPAVHCFEIVVEQLRSRTAVKFRPQPLDRRRQGQRTVSDCGTRARNRFGRPIEIKLGQEFTEFFDSAQEQRHLLSKRCSRRTRGSLCRLALIVAAACRARYDISPRTHRLPPTPPAPAQQLGHFFLQR